MGFTPQMLGVLAWLVLAIMGLWPKRRGLHFQLAALAIGLLFCLGPMGEAGVIELRSYRWHPHLQPGLFMALVSGGIISFRLWLRVRKGYFRSQRLRWFDLSTLLIVLAAVGIIHYDHTEQAAAIINRIQASGDASPDDLSKLMLAIAHDYPAYGHAEGEMSYDYRFAPGMCRGVGGPSARISESDDPATHGSKLYTVYARNRDAYMSLWEAKWARRRQEMDSPPQDQPIGQVIVKESFAPTQMPDDERMGSGLKAAVRDGKRYRPGARRDLFVMVNLGANVKGTDSGWVYGTLSPDYRSVTSAGLVQSCMKCHDSLPIGRVFGLPLAEDETTRPSSVPTTAP